MATAVPARADLIERDSRWPLFALILGALAAASIIVAAVHARANGCIFDDGAAYCRMAAGGLAPEPWSHRVTVPALVSALPSGWLVGVRFKVVAVVAAAGATVATFALAWQLLRVRAPARTLYAAALASAAIVALSPHLFRLALTTPVLVDQAAIFTGLVWCLLVTANARWLRWLSLLVVLVVVPTREAWVLPLLLAAGVLWWKGERGLAAATAVATLAAGVFTFTRPSAPGRYSAVIQILHDGRVTLLHPDHAAWAVLFGIGLAPAIAVLLFARWQRLRDPVGIVLATACGHLVQAPLAGTDVSRYAAAALPFAIVLAVVVVAESGTSRAFWGLAVFTAATLVLWQPFRIVAPGVRSYAAMYYPGSASALIALGGLILIVGVLAWVLRGDEPLPARTRAHRAHPASDA
jgi:hypothetical protein